MSKLPKAPFEKILKEEGQDLRVSDSAAKALTSAIEEISRKIARDAAEFAKHTQRRTILDSDVTLAAKRRHD